VCCPLRDARARILRAALALALGTAWQPPLRAQQNPGPESALPIEAAQPAANPAPGSGASAAAPPRATPPTSDLPILDALPFLPVPEIDTAPYSGLTVGLIPVVLSTNDKGEIDRILAPDIIYSQYFGWGARWRIFRNPSEDEKWSVVGGAKESVEREFDANYSLGLLRNSAWSWNAHVVYDRSGTGRFYGLGNASLHADETAFIDSRLRLDATAARNFGPAWQLAYRVRAQSDNIEQDTLTELPSINVLFPGLPGVGYRSQFQQRVVVSYDTRDSVTVPHQGERLAAFAGYSARLLDTSSSFSFLGADASVLRPIGPDVTIAGHAALRYMPSYLGAPFWALSSVGGDRSVLGEEQPLRAYGAGRFIDRNSDSASIEARTAVEHFHVLNTDLKLELAPFLDTGKVFATMSENPLTHQHLGGGMGFRMVASPFVVGYLDIGFGHERLAVFSGIDYPF
jgi:outer membrane translocation and assembly module TamA